MPTKKSKSDDPAAEPAKKPEKPRKKKKKVEEEEVPKTTHQLISDMVGAGVRVFSGSELITPQRIRRPLGIPSVDVEIAGGFPGAAISNIWGPPSACKTWGAFRTLTQQQKIFGDDFVGVYISLGLHPDISFARLHGLQVPYESEAERQHFIQTYYGIHGSPPTDRLVEHAGQKVGQLFVLFPEEEVRTGKGQTMELNSKPLERLFASTVEISRSRLCQMIVVDDIGGMPTQDRLSKTMSDEPKVADHARVLSQWVTRMALTLQMVGTNTFNYTSLLTLSQVRLSIGSYGGYQPVSSTAMNHLLGTALSFKLDGSAQGGTTQEKKRINWKITKGKHGHSDGATGNFFFYPSTGVDYISDLFTTAKKYNILETGGSVVQFEGTKRKGHDDFKDAMADDADLAKAIHDKLISVKCPGALFR